MDWKQLAILAAVAFVIGPLVSRQGWRATKTLFLAGSVIVGIGLIPHACYLLRGDASAPVFGRHLLLFVGLVAGSTLVSWYAKRRERNARSWHNNKAVRRYFSRRIK